jgi:hypothetical protein
MINCVRLTTNGTISDITVNSDQVYQVLGKGSMTFVGTICDLDVVAMANSDIPLEEPNVFCKWLGFDDTSSDIVLVKTDQTGNPISLYSSAIRNMMTVPS